ncbi:E3 ubiquitin-protein ligase DTX1, partial [Geospiza fortis]|uniref:E3 ubiquitin-protein ligase n=1 Tax=Geospiza fortis TaxID=48883 RepID=A0A8N5EZU4_GEOFO
LNEHGRWRPYSAAVCHHIENVLKEDARGSVVLGQVDVQLAPYVIDLQSMHQFRQDTGTMRPVRRNFYDPSSAPGKGIVWEWENDNNSWTPYDMDICITIQNAYEKQHPWLDLSSLGFCYLIYFSSMSQMNRQTQRKRRLRRRMDLAYPLTMGSIPKSQSWPVGASTGTPSCSCPQCLLVNSTRAVGAGRCHPRCPRCPQDGSLQCPTCKAIYGEKTGTQPPGKMEFHLIPHSLPGYTDSKTIRIVYDIPTGIQGPEHPNPGKKFTARGFPRHCYLPDNEKGRKNGKGWEENGCDGMGRNGMG